MTKFNKLVGIVVMICMIIMTLAVVADFVRGEDDEITSYVIDDNGVLSCQEFTEPMNYCVRGYDEEHKLPTVVCKV